MINKKENERIPLRLRDERIWPEINYNRRNNEKYDHKYEDNQYQERSYVEVAKPTNYERKKEDESLTDKIRRTIRPEYERVRRDELKRKEEIGSGNLYKDFNQREGEIRKDNYGLVMRYSQDITEERDKVKEKRNEEYLMEKIEKVITAFEVSVERLTRINERSMKAIEEEPRDIRRLRDRQQEERYEETELEDRRRNLYKRNYNIYGSENYGMECKRNKE